MAISRDPRSPSKWAWGVGFASLQTVVSLFSAPGLLLATITWSAHGAPLVDMGWTRDLNLVLVAQDGSIFQVPLSPLHPSHDPLPIAPCLVALACLSMPDKQTMSAFSSAVKTCVCAPSVVCLQYTLQGKQIPGRTGLDAWDQPYCEGGLLPRHGSHLHLGGSASVHRPELQGRSPVTWVQRTVASCTGLAWGAVRDGHELEVWLVGHPISIPCRVYSMVVFEVRLVYSFTLFLCSSGAASPVVLPPTSSTSPLASSAWRPCSPPPKALTPTLTPPLRPSTSLPPSPRTNPLGWLPPPAPRCPLPSCSSPSTPPCSSSTPRTGTALYVPHACQHSDGCTSRHCAFSRALGSIV